MSLRMLGKKNPSTVIYPDSSKAVQASLTEAAACFWKYASC